MCKQDHKGLTLAVNAELKKALNSVLPYDVHAKKPAAAAEKKAKPATKKRSKAAGDGDDEGTTPAKKARKSRQ
jgi:hypothetical protein